jgi:hypothetical protein
MLKGIIDTKDFGVAGTAVVQFKAKCLERDIVKRTPGAVEALSPFFSSSSFSYTQKKTLSGALYGLGAWLESNRPEAVTLDLITPADVQGYLDTVTKNEARIQRRGGLRRAFDTLAEHSILPKDHNLLPHLLPGPKKDNTLPFIVRNSGEAVVTAVEAFFREKYPDLDERKHKPHLSALRGLENWAAPISIPALTAMNVRDGTAYLDSIDNRETSYGHAYLLREVFEYLLARGLVKSNPFIYADANPERLDEKLQHILQLARKTGGKAEELLREFLNLKSTAKKSLFHCSSALDHFALWLMKFKHIENLRMVSRDILQYYRTEVMTKEYTADSVRSMASGINQLFLFMAERGFFTEKDPALSISQHKNMRLANVKTRLSVIRVLRIGAKLRKARFTPGSYDFNNLDLDVLSYRERLSAAGFIDYISRCRFRKGQFQPGCHVLRMNQPPSETGLRQLNERTWAEAGRFGMVEMNEGTRVLSRPFVKRYNSGLKEWACDFITSHQHASQMRDAEKVAGLEKRSPRRPRKARQKSEELKDCAA